jgi:hypothetical protein
MAGMGFILGGAMKGYGDGKLEQAKAKREAALEELRWQRQMQAAGDDRAFRSEENEKDRKFRKEEGAQSRSDQETRDLREDTRRRDSDKAERYTKARQEFINSGMDPEEASREALRSVNEYERNSKLPTFSDPSEVDAAVAAGKIKPGESFVLPDGSLGRVPDPTSVIPELDSTSTSSMTPEQTKAAEMAGNRDSAPPPERRATTFRDGVNQALGRPLEKRDPKPRGSGGSGF